jgi:hypothetical protein
VLGYVQGWYGGGSWVILAFLALALFRIFAARNRRGGMPPGRPGRGRPWMSGPGTASRFSPPSTEQAEHKAPEAGQGIPEGWFADPSGRFEQRYWSGTKWTEHVTKGGVPSVDPPQPRGSLDGDAVADDPSGRPDARDDRSSGSAS